jgi:predicted CXXCH cytochrome family protein
VISRLSLVASLLFLTMPLVAQESHGNAPVSAAYVGSHACQLCHFKIYERWKKTPMANVVRDPREHPDAILGDFSTMNTEEKFSKDDVALVYGNVWKQLYFKKVGDDYFVLPGEWDMTHGVWHPYAARPGTEWWVPYYSPDSMKRPTGPLCDGCHSVNYDIHTKNMTEWNVGCERCHGPGSEHVKAPSRSNIVNPARLATVNANDVCIQCHARGLPLANPLNGQYFNWPVGYRVGLDLQNFWKLADHKLGETTFTFYPDGTGHVNREQGNDFVQSEMYSHGVRCWSCHDAHGTDNESNLLKPTSVMCLECHGPSSPNGPHASTIEAHTHHKAGSPGSECVECHMPKIERNTVDVYVRSHTFRFITPAMTEQYQIPNPCNLCHADKSTQWATEAMQHWPEQSQWRLKF